MATIIEHALMAGASYISTRADINQFPVPAGWFEPIEKRGRDDTTGFEATYFTRGTGANTEIIISFAGTNPTDITGDIAANLALATGSGSEQLLQAADYYLQIKASAPAGATISLTGHSLGGGLASLLAVFFGESAQTFDQAPFRNSATNILVAQNLRTYLVQKESGNIPADKLAQLLAPLDAYITALDPTNTNKIAADTLAGRQGLVSNINVQGEFLSSWYGVPSSNRIGSSLQPDIPNSNGGVSGLDLHSQALLTAFLQSNPTGAAQQGLNGVTAKLTDLLRMVFDPSLFAHPTSDPQNPNFLELIVNHQAGRDPLTNTTITPDAMVTRFTSDMWKIAQDGGLTMTGAVGDTLPDGTLLNPIRTALNRTLIAFAMQKY